MSDLADSTLSSLRRGSNSDVYQQDHPRSTAPAAQSASKARQQMGRSKSAERRSLGSYENTIIFQPIISPPNEFDTNDSGLVGLLENNQKWAKAIHAERPQFFHDIALKQEPKLLWIGCSDSRVPANQIVNLGPGEVFVHRNIANVVVHTDLNCLSVLQYAVEVLKVEHVVVCGHYRCGGVSASMHKHQYGMIDNWLRNIKDVYQANRENLMAIKDDDERERRLVELNVENSARNVAHSTIVQNAWRTDQRLLIHSWVYDLETGFINSLPLCIQNPTLLDDIYSYD
jgi:carbonic anhydrase